MVINKDKQINKNTIILDLDFVALEMDFYDKYNRDKNYKVQALVSYKPLDKLIKTADEELKDFISRYKRFNEEQKEDCIEYFELVNKDDFEKIISISDGIYFSGQWEYWIFEKIDYKAGILISQVESEKDFLENEIRMIENLIKQEKLLIKSIPKRSDLWFKKYQEELKELKEELKRLD